MDHHEVAGWISPAQSVPQSKIMSWGRRWLRPAAIRLPNLKSEIYNLKSKIMS